MALFENIEFTVAAELKDLDQLSNLISADFHPESFLGLKEEPLGEFSPKLEISRIDNFPPESPDSIGASSRPSSGQSSPSSQYACPDQHFSSPTYSNLPYYSPSFTPTQFTSPQPASYPPQPHTPYYHQSGKSQIDESQVFFPPTFPANFQSYPEPIWNRGLADYLRADYETEQPSNFALSPIGKAQSSLKTRRRASRSRCPCIKCCNARANCIPSPSTHACMVKGCSKTYTRPAHLRAHLKSHENDAAPKCEICLKTVMSADLFIVHMFEHGKEMKL